jgi:hypothetical protein
VGPSGSGALSPRRGEKGDQLRQNIMFLGALVLIIAIAAVVA